MGAILSADAVFCEDQHLSLSAFKEWLQLQGKQATIAKMAD